MTQVAPCHGRLLGPLWADLAKILVGWRARIWPQMIKISLGCVKVRERSNGKTLKKAGRKRQKSSVIDGFSIVALIFHDASQ